MHRGVGDRTCAPEGTFTVAGLCRDLTGFATTRRDRDVERTVAHDATGTRFGRSVTAAAAEMLDRVGQSSATDTVMASSAVR